MNTAENFKKEMYFTFILVHVDDLFFNAQKNTLRPWKPLRNLASKKEQRLISSFLSMARIKK